MSLIQALSESVVEKYPEFGKLSSTKQKNLINKTLQSAIKTALTFSDDELLIGQTFRKGKRKLQINFIRRVLKETLTDSCPEEGRVCISKDLGHWSIIKSK